MDRPVRWNPVAVTIAKLDTPSSVVDPVFKAPTNRAVRSQEYIYPAQVNFGLKAKEKAVRTLMGDRANTKARLVMRFVDLAPTTNLPRPAKGDRITKLYVGTPAEEVVDYTIEEVRPESPLASEGGIPVLLFVEFERDRENV